MISRFKILIKNLGVVGITTTKIECAIDETVVSCDTLSEKQDTWTGIPAPVYLEDDEWFGTAPVKSQKQLDYMEQEVEVKRQERSENFSVEPDNMHEVMYNMATLNQSTTLHIDPPGGSENFQEGWQSGLK